MSNYYTVYDYCYKPEFCGKSATGLYPHEILLLFYIDKGSLKKPYAKFWNDTYGVSDVDALIKSLTARGYISDSKLTDKGKEEIASNEWVLKAHRNKNYGISLCTMARLVSQNPGVPKDQLIYNELTRRANLSFTNDPMLYVVAKEQMTELFEDEKRYDCAIWAISEALYFQINVTSTQYAIDNKMLVVQSNVEKLKNYLFAEGMSTDTYINEYAHVLRSAPKQGRVLSLYDSALLIVAYMDGDPSAIDTIYKRAKSVKSDECSVTYSDSDYDGSLITKRKAVVSPRPKNRLSVHIILFILTFGFGNILYYLYIRSKQQAWDKMYSL